MFFSIFFRDVFIQYYCNGCRQMVENFMHSYQEMNIFRTDPISQVFLRKFKENPLSVGKYKRNIRLYNMKSVELKANFNRFYFQSKYTTTLSIHFIGSSFIGLL
ncbi:hypothetical protein ABEB36_014675 [Hypothenemus hampei]|uniref:Uncharacterized protein n=1 Tax=Hypothenemus hampei TaxID=57062 RepID=A0ABD1E4K4_HYPHA